MVWRGVTQRASQATCANKFFARMSLTAAHLPRRPAVPFWIVSFILFWTELALWVWITRRGVDKAWWSDLQGALLLVAFPFCVRLLGVAASYTFSRLKGVVLEPGQRLSAARWMHFFASEYFHFCMQSLLLLPFRVFFRTATERGRGPSRGRVIVLQHGFMHNGGVWFFTARALERLGYRVFAVDQPLYACIDAMAERLHQHIERIVEDTGEAQITLIAHSMGGLIARAYLRKFSGERLRQLITLGSPHQGTYHAIFAGGINGRQMRRGNAWLTALATERTTTRFVSIYSLHDTIITPQDSSWVDGAQNVVVTGIGHVAMPSGRRMRTHIVRALAD
jgi:predicted alpha/beta hydrolase family esterase